MRHRSPSYSPPPRRGYGGRGRSPSPRERYSPRREPPTSLLVRNLSRKCKPEDLRGPFGQFGRIRDIYLPRDYYTGDPRGFGFVQYLDPYDAEEAQYYMNRQMLHGREITVVFAEENRKKPSEMRVKEKIRGRGGNDSRHSSPYHGGLHSRSRYKSRSPSRRSLSRSSSPVDRKSRYRSHERRSKSPSPVNSRSIKPSVEKDLHRSPRNHQRSRSRSRSLSVPSRRGQSPRSRSKSPGPSDRHPVSEPSDYSLQD